MKYIGVVLAVLAAVAPAVVAQDKLTYVDLIKRLTDLERLAVLPQPGETCAQWSSYDRHSKYDEATGKYVAWDANDDGGHFIRQEDGNFVFAEMEGPGCIWRIWSARPEAGHVRIYLDGSTKPAVDLPFKAYFDGTAEPFNRSSLCYEAAAGWNCYLPIPYQKSCKVVADNGWGAYFHFTYGTFPKGTELPTFKRQLSANEAAALDAADAALKNLGHDPAGDRPGQAEIRKTIKAKRGRTVRVARMDGPGAITSLRAQVNLAESDDAKTALRELALQIAWDGEKAPSVWAPFGDFFGTAAGANTYESLPMGLTKDGWWYSRWYMPFAESACIEVSNHGRATRRIEFRIDHAPLTRPADQLGRFHAKWHRDALLPSEPERWIDWPMVKTEGRGRFCGVMLHSWNPKGGWWGEGDEKFFVDGQKFPCFFGTGSEDYFGYAWCNPTLFARPYHNQTISMNNKGHVSVNRWHITDNVPFQKSFEGYIEKYFPNDKPTLYASTVYWYLAEGGRDPYARVPLTERTGYWSELKQPARVAGAIEGEKLRILGKTAGNAVEQNMAPFEGEWSNESQLWWTQATVGDKLELALPVEKAGTYMIVMTFTCAPDYGIVQCSLDGETLRGPTDLFHPVVKPFGPFDMGALDLAAGEHRLAFEIIGANTKAVKAYMVGLDYVKLLPVVQ